MTTNKEGNKQIVNIFLHKQRYKIDSIRLATTLKISG